MEKQVSTKIRLLLNELAILNQPERSGSEFIYQKDTLAKLKSLGAELYMLADNAILHGEYKPAEGTQVPRIEIAEKRMPEPEVAEPVLELIAEPVPEPPVAPVIETPAPVELPAAEEPVETISEPALVLPPEPIITHEADPHLVETHNKPRLSADSISSRISLTRRFEYINNLFGGNAELFLEFLDEIAFSKDQSEAMEIFDRFADRHSWQKKAEAAGDFRKIIQKLS
ncbi:MAG: hypothetical protein JNL57_10945 [Bacteroidetes bacterium]|nr:hypothetical protein [Bacteroidota bacterium]